MPANWLGANLIDRHRGVVVRGRRAGGLILVLPRWVSINRGKLLPSIKEFPKCLNSSAGHSRLAICPGLVRCVVEETELLRGVNLSNPSRKMPNQLGQ